jgi:DinB family protein
VSATTEALARRATMLHTSAVELVEKVADDKMVRRLGPTAPPIAFHLWHMARWADRMQARVSALVPNGTAATEIWARECLADAWRIEVPLGRFDSGMEMGDEASAAFVFPTKASLLDYTHKAFDAAQRLYDGLGDANLEARGRDMYDREASVAAMLVAHLTHLNRHLGMIEALVGVSGEKGTASV